ncbi:hypothetical protein L202_04563 [Cryptococcus amylolentus CBS 6039]|uniref:Uncharacterized protein n=1 Tax=Cryptococcus amylolentus CBS 6039 TaxID=1295533 RepID=A0A1E3HMJ0_9TREE|nr:hypothetical protein L202_04563 [Cryptococcus amylolentus CBS 6039]ODN77375.1 hypothetical protein L202_04563 [Cryptococcus amylolentus CBS 6039]
MGYSGIIGFILRNKHRKAAYNHFESEPDRQGHWIAQFIIGLSPEQCLEMADLWIEEENHRDLVSDEIKERYLAFDGKWKYEFPHVGPQLWLYKDHLGGRYKEKIGKIIQCEEAQAAEELEERRKTYLKHFEEYGYSRYRKTWHDVLCRAQGAESLRLIQQGKLSHLLEKSEFACHHGKKSADQVFTVSHIYDANWAYFIDFHHQKMEVWAEDVLVREVTFDMLRGNPDYMLDFDWFKMRDTDWYKRPDTHWYYKDEDSDEDVF